MPRARWLACAVLFSSLMSGTALAQTDSDTPPEAVEFYRQAREHYEAGEYREAADDLERALMLDPDSPTLVYNLARVYELLGEPARALMRYEQYQTLLPQQQAREQEDAAATIRRLHGAAATARPEQQLASPREVAPLRQLPGLVLVRENGVADAAFWGVLGGGALALITGAILAGVALDQKTRVDNWVHGDPQSGGDGTEEDQLSTHDSARLLGISADIGLGVGGIAVIAAGLLYFLRDHTVERAPIEAVDENDDQATLMPSLSAGPDHASVGVIGSW